MRLDDHLMTILTGLVLAILVGIMAQKSDYFIDAFTGERMAVAEDDNFIIRAGRDQVLDVLMNDSAPGAGVAPEDLRIVSRPACGQIKTDQGKVLYSGSEECDGLITFSYCLEKSQSCTPAHVVLNVRPERTLIASAVTEVKSSASTDSAEPIMSAFVVTPELLVKSFDADFGALTPERVSRFLVDPTTDGLAGAPRALSNVAVAQHPHPLDPTQSARFLLLDDNSEIQGIRHATSGSSQ